MLKNLLKFPLTALFHPQQIGAPWQTLPRARKQICRTVNLANDMQTKYKRVLEIGPAERSIVEELRSAGMLAKDVHITLMELMPDFVETLQKRYRGWIPSENILQGDATEILTEMDDDVRYDGIFLSSPNLNAQEGLKFFRHLYERLEEGGNLVIWNITEVAYRNMLEVFGQEHILRKRIYSNLLPLVCTVGTKPVEQFARNGHGGIRQSMMPIVEPKNGTMAACNGHSQDHSILSGFNGVKN